MLRAAWRQPGRYKIRSRQKRRTRRLAAPFVRFFEVLFWHWIGAEVCVDQRPFVSLFHKNARRFCASCFVLSILVLSDADIIVSQDGDIPVYLDFGIGHVRRDRLARGFSCSLPQA